MSGRILLVDDEPDVLLVMRYALEQEGYEVLPAETGSEALRLVDAEHTDLVILDIMLPDVDGVELLRRIRQRHNSLVLPVIMLSAKSQVSTKVEALEAGADEYVVKPVHAEELVARVASLVRRSRLAGAASRTPEGRVLVFLGAKGGVGTTTVALNVAAGLSREGRSVIVAELRGDPGTCALQMGVSPREDVTNLLVMDPVLIGRKELEGCLVPVPAFGLRALFGPQSSSAYSTVEPALAQAIVTGLASMADEVVIDLPSCMTGAGQEAIRKSDVVILVVEREPFAIMCAERTVEWLRTLGAAGTRLRTVLVARTALPMGESLQEIGSRLGSEVLGVVPPSLEAHVRAQERGVPLVEPDLGNMAAESFVRIVERLAEDTRETSMPSEYDANSSHRRGSE